MNLRSGRIPLHWLQSHPAFPIQPDRSFDFLKNLQRFPENTVPCIEGHQVHHRN